MNEDTTMVWMTKEQCALFILFQKDYDSFAQLIAEKVFDTKRGNVTINFNEDGVITSVEKKTYHYPQRVATEPIAEKVRVV